MSLEVTGRKLLPENTKYYPSGRKHHRNKRERFLKHNAVFQWNYFSTTEYHLFDKYIVTKVTTRNNLKKKKVYIKKINPYIPTGKIVLWCEDMTLT